MIETVEAIELLGEVKTWNAQKGWGHLISRRNGSIYFAHSTRLRNADGSALTYAEKCQPLAPGTPVKFNVFPNDAVEPGKFPLAFDIRLRLKNA